MNGSVDPKLVLVNEQDQVVGYEDKMLTHQKGLMHRAFSVFVFDQQHRLLLQQRHADKYHCGGLWTNACCSHPYPNESIVAAGQRRLQQEMGFILPLVEVGVFHYIAQFDNGLTENEVDHVLIGWYQQQNIEPQPQEVAAYRWLSINDLKNDLSKWPQRYTVWLSPALAIAEKFLQEMA